MHNVDGFSFFSSSTPRTPFVLPTTRFIRKIPYVLYYIHGISDRIVQIYSSVVLCRLVIQLTFGSLGDDEGMYTLFDGADFGLLKSRHTESLGIRCHGISTEVNGDIILVLYLM